MKYARIDIETIGIVNKDEKCHLNFGDHLQNIVIKDYYKKIGIKEQDIYVLNFNEISTYNGEYLILPINQAISRGIHKFLSPKIIPVFLGLSRDASAISVEEIEYFRQFEPIGCRDEAILGVLKDRHVKCYLNGCITATLDKRKNPPKTGVVYIIEAPSFAIEEMPTELRENAVFWENAVYERPSEFFQRTTIEQYVSNRYLTLKEKASLVVTSRMHIASPCIAMGIPVILVRNSIDYRFSWIDKFIPIYTKENVKKINWNPEISYFEHQKEIITNFACKRIVATFEKYKSQIAISEFFESRMKVQYDLPEFSDSVIRFVNQNWEKSESWKYSIWGENDASERLYNYLTEMYPNAKYTAFYDSYRNLNYHGKQAQHPKNINPHEDEFIFVTGYTATDAARELFEQIGKPSKTYYLFGGVVRGYK